MSRTPSFYQFSGDTQSNLKESPLNPGLYDSVIDNWGRASNSKEDSRQALVAEAVRELKSSRDVTQKLVALDFLYESGIHSFNMTDSGNVERQMRIEKEQVGKMTLLNVFTRDDSGRERVFMRAAIDPDGNFERQRDKKGDPVSYYGDWISGKRSSPSKEEVHKPGKPRDLLPEDDVPPRRRTEGVRRSDRNDRSDRDERHERRDKFNFGRAFGEALMTAAPFLLSQLGRNRHCDNYYDRYADNRVQSHRPQYPNYYHNRDNWYYGGNHYDGYDRRCYVDFRNPCNNKHKRDEGRDRHEHRHSHRRRDRCND